MSELKTDSKSERHETEDWHHAYRSDVLSERRVATHGKKLRRLGIYASRRDSKILDVCCGEGEMLDLLFQDGFHALTGVDLAWDEKARRYLSGKPWHYVAGSGAQFPFKKESFDWVLCAHSLHHLWPLENIRFLVQNGYDTLKPGGKLALIDHYDAWQVRLAFRLILSPLALVTEWTRAFRRQHLEEKDQLYGYLKAWPKVEEILLNAGFATVSFKKGLFFFYYVAEK